MEVDYIVKYDWIKSKLVGVIVKQRTLEGLNI